MNRRTNRRSALCAIAALSAAPLSGWAQQKPRPVIGFLSAHSPESAAGLVAGFRRGLTETGLQEGRDVVVEFGWAHGRYDQLPSLVRTLVQRPASVIVTAGGDVAVMAAKAATDSIPIVFSMGSDPVKMGLIRSFNRPGGKLTGVMQLTTALDAKRLELLREMVPSAKSVAALLNPNRSLAKEQLHDIQEAAKRLGIRLVAFQASSESDFEPAFTAMAQQRFGALLVGADPFFFSNRARIVELATRFRMPAMYEFKDFVAQGGLISFGTDLADSYRLLGTYAGRILKGEKPEEIPVIQPTKFELIINRTTAQSLGITIPQSLLQRADELIG